MKRWSERIKAGRLYTFFHTGSLTALCVAACSMAGENLPPRPCGPVADYAELIDNQVEIKINHIARTLWQKRHFGLIIATIADIGATPIDSFASMLYSSWGVGAKEEPHDLLAVLSLNPPGIHVVSGSATKTYLSDTLIQSILEKKALALFNKGGYGEGLLAICSEIGSVVTAQEKPEWQNGIASAAMTASLFRCPDNCAELGRYCIVTAAVSVILLLFLIAGRRRHKRLEFLRTPFGQPPGSGPFGGRFSLRQR